jgi:hypothetical protein
MSDVPSVIVESTGVDATHAFDSASHRIERAVRSSLGRPKDWRVRTARATQGPSRRKVSKKTSKKVSRAKQVPNAPPAAGSLIGRRVGRSEKNLEVAIEHRRARHVDTSAPGVSASDKKAGGGATAARNPSLRARKATVALEDSATGKPSRKSTRGGTQRAKSGSKQRRRAVRVARSPKRRASKAQARRGGR